MAKKGKHAKENLAAASEDDAIQYGDTSLGKHAGDVKEPEPIQEEPIFVEEDPVDFADEAFDDFSEELVSAPAGLEFDDPERVAKKAKRRKVAKVAAASVAGGLAAVYLAGAAAFSFLFFPNTTVGGSDVSLKQAAEVEQVLSDVASGYAFTVEGQGVSLSMTSEEAGISFDTAAVVSDMRGHVNAFAWPYEVFQEHDLSECAVVQYSSTVLQDSLRAACDAVNAEATPPVDATIGYSAEADAVAVIPEQYGTQIDADEVVAYVEAQNNQLATQIALPEEVLVEADLRQDDERLAKAAEEANKFMTVDLALKMGGQQVAAVDVESMSTWIAMDENFQVSMSEELMAAWIKQAAADLSTAGSERTYTRPDGKEVTVSGGDYGWKVDEAAFETLVRDAVANSQQGEADIPLKQEGQVYNGPGVADWGKRYVDVDLTEQHARFYDENGELIWESDIVSGGPGASRATPTGVWDLNDRRGYTMLVGRNPDGSIDYETPVNYWMPFKGNSHGLHDATWRGSFGGSIYTYNGSHGCVNLPLSKAKELYNLIQVGDVVITHK